MNEERIIHSLKSDWLRNRMNKLLSNDQFVRLKVLTAVNMTMLLFRVVTPRGLAGRYRRTAFGLRAEDEGSVLVRNVGYLPTRQTGSELRGSEH
jgi:hypothetical protein